MLKPSTACRLDSESEKITNFFNFDQRITSIARNEAYSSARKMLVTFWQSYAFDDAFIYNNRGYSFAHFRAVSVYATTILVLIAKLVKTMLMNLCRNINFVSTVQGFTTGRMRSHGGVETMLEDKTFIFWKPTSFKSHETRILS